MGLDFLDVTFRLERSLGVSLTQDDLQSIERNGDVRVGDLYELLLSKLGIEDNFRNSYSLNQVLWLDIQAVLSEVTRIPKSKILLQSSLDVMFPKPTRREDWDRLADLSAYAIPELDYSPVVRLMAVATAILVAYLEIQNLRIVPWLFPLMGFLSIWVFAETYLKMLKILTPYRQSIPSNLATVKELCRAVLSLNYEEICRDATHRLAFSTNLDERCLSVWKELVETLSETLGADTEEIDFRTRLLADLGMG